MNVEAMKGLSKKLALPPALTEAADSLRERGSQWLASLPERDRRALLLLAVFLLPLAFYLAVWHPARAAVQNAAEALEQAQQLHGQMSTLASSGVVSRTPGPTASQLPVVLQQLAQSDNVNVGRLEVTAEGVKISIPEISLIGLTRFLQDCQHRGMNPSEADIHRLGEGRHEVRLLFPLGGR